MLKSTYRKGIIYGKYKKLTIAKQTVSVWYNFRSYIKISVDGVQKYAKYGNNYHGHEGDGVDTNISIDCTGATEVILYWGAGQNTGDYTTDASIIDFRIQ